MPSLPLPAITHRDMLKAFCILFFSLGSMFSLKGQPFLLGSDYYPEHFSIQDVGRDARIMQGAGLKVVRMGDFAWHKMQPEEQSYTLGWLKAAVDSLGTNHIKTLLCTPTAAIPKWMFDKYPQIMQIMETGLPKPYGKRRHACLNNAVYRSFSKKIAEALARSFANNPNVEGFQIDNELMAEEPYCYCETCRMKFAGWLKRKYVSIDSLNRTWGLAFWSETLDSFDQAFIPRKGDNPGCFVDYQAFYSDCTIEYFNLQRDAIKQINPRFRITHNVCSSGFLYKMDLYKLGERCDFLSLDNYPFTWTLENEYGPVDNFEYHPAMASMALSQTRGASKAPFWVAESQISRTAGRQRKLIPPGMVRLWCHQELAHGAKSVLFFPYRTFEYAHEQMMNGVVDADNVPRRRYEEVKKTSKELYSIDSLLHGARPLAQAAILRDFRCDYAFEDGRFSADFRYMRHIYSYYRALREKGITVDIVSPLDNFEKYPLIIVPAQVLMTKELSQRLRRATESGCEVVITCMTGLRNNDMKSFGRLLSRDIEELAGIEMEEQFSLIKQENTKLSFSQSDKEYTCSLWFDLFKPRSTQVLAIYESRFLKGKPAVVKNTEGKGHVFYIGTIPSDDMIDDLTTTLVRSANLVQRAVASNKLVDITELGGDKRFVYIINFSGEEQKVKLSGGMKDLLTQQKEGDFTVVAAMDFKVLEVL